MVESKPTRSYDPDQAWVRNEINRLIYADIPENVWKSIELTEILLKRLNELFEKIDLSKHINFPDGTNK